MVKSYSYKIISTDYESDVMEVLYKTEGKPDQYIGMPVPVGNESYEDIIKRHAPLRYWDSLDAAPVRVIVGTSGVISLDEPPSTVIEQMTPGTGPTEVITPPGNIETVTVTGTEPTVSNLTAQDIAAGTAVSNS